MNELHTIVNNVHENWWVIWGIWLIPKYYQFFWLVMFLKSGLEKQIEILEKAMKSNKYLASLVYDFYKLLTLLLLLLTILYWII